MDLFREYLEESQGSRLLETDTGFLAFRIVGEQFYISDFHVNGAFRKSKVEYRRLLLPAFQLAKHSGCKYFAMHAALAAPNLNEMLLVRLKLGFRVTGCEDSKLCLVMLLEECPKWLREE